MTGELGYSLPPAIRRIAGAFRIVGWISFWIQAVLGVISSLVLLFSVATLSGRATQGETNPGTSAGLLFAVLGVLAVFAGAFWSFRYTRLSRKLRTSNPDLRPKPKDAIRAIQIGLMISLAGMLVTLLGAEAIVGSLLAKSLAQPQGSALFNPGNVTQFIQPLDIFIVQANTHTLVAHFAAIASALWLYRSVNRQ
ncbi:DUF3611 family protein [Romeria aff. gracilis LEGE 07310]|uniref:DUF3611 family protein n=1 Tax=Vasconcelosia minhoensis LEGE 07310 TaxID=915328 RepID=A0A8J7APR8_9CYAN|nr:DUF3611 family protein [Romeria gracilis]MBE9078031.1 DUF3611 family protein [Romeria aff. gracilis LEGE 07310]